MPYYYVHSKYVLGLIADRGGAFQGGGSNIALNFKAHYLTDLCSYSNAKYILAVATCCIVLYKAKLD